MFRELMTSSVYQPIGLFILRLTLGVSFIYHGFSKMFSPHKWDWLGSQMPIFNIESLNSFWGFMASFSEFFGGVFLVLGIFVRPSVFLLFITMAVAINYHHNKSEGFELPLVYAVCCIILVISGPCRWSLDQKLFSKTSK